MERIGVFICECGPNIKDAIELEEVERFVQDLEDVVLVKRFGLLCSNDGKAIIANHIKEHDLNRIVIAACSPKEHETTFKSVLEETGFNPFLLQMANIREQCAWVIKDKARATQKAKEIINAAVRRVRHNEPLEVKEIECQPDVLVVGGGISGISSALTLAQRNRKVYLVEKLACIGGKTARYEDLFPTMECASCILDPKLDEVLHNENIEVLTLSEVQEALGFYGNFVAKVHKKARFVDLKSCIGCGACVEVCPVKARNEYNEGLDARKAIYIPYAGAMPNVAAIDKTNCLRWQGEECNACQVACPFGSINYEDTDQIQELRVGAIVLATGFDLFDPEQALRYGYGKFENVYTSLEFERLLSSTGPTGGKILLKNGQPPEEVVFVHCVGSRSKDFHEYCSGICCMYTLKFAHQVMDKLPGVSIIELYADFCLPGKASQGFYNRIASENAIQFIRMKKPDSIEIIGGNGKLSIRYVNAQREYKTITADMVVLAPAIEGARGASDVAKVFDISQGDGGFFTEEDEQIAPVSTASRGIFIAGCAQGPQDIQSSVAQGQAAAGAILSKLIPGEKLALEAMSAEIDEDLCSRCMICVDLCPYKAIAYDDSGGCVEVNKMLCRGCGSCAAACPSGAIKACHFTDRQIWEEINGVMGEV